MRYAIDVNKYKFQIAIKKPWWRTSLYYKKIYNSLSVLPNWLVRYYNNIMIIDLYFNYELMLEENNQSEVMFHFNKDYC